MSGTSTTRGLNFALKGLASKRKILLALDFDGTVSNLVVNPDGARMTDKARSILRKLGELDGVTIALISGRSLGSLVRVSKPLPNWLLVGSHGIELSWAESSGGVLANSELPKSLLKSFEYLSESHPGSRIENKPFGLAIHTRGLGAAESAVVEDEVRRICIAWGEKLVFRVGKGVAEFSVREGTKADGIAALKEQTEPVSTLFAGDDLTDEDGFRELSAEDIGIRVGDGNTIAKYRLPDVNSVAQALATIYVERCKQFAH